MFACFVPGLFAYLADIEQVSAAIECRKCILPEQMAQTSFVIVEVFERTVMVENEGVIWYHIVSLSLGNVRKQRRQHTLVGVLPFHS